MRWCLIDADERIVAADSGGLGGALAEWLRGAAPPEAGAGVLAALHGEGGRRTIETPDGPIELQCVAGAAGGTLLTLQSGQRESAHAAELQRRIHLHENILNGAMDGFFIVDEDCRFLRVNDAFCRMLGYGADELLAMRITDLELSDAQSDSPAFTRTGLHHFPAAHRHKRGHTVHLELSVNVLRDSGHKMLVGFARDVTEKRRTEEALTRLTWQHKLILHSAAEGIAGIDAEGRFTFINPAGAQSLGAQAGELIRGSAHRLLLGRDPGAPECLSTSCPLCAGAPSRGRAAQGEATFVRADGTRFPAVYSLTPILESGALVSAVLVFRDITEQRRAEEERRAFEAHVQQAHRLESLGLLAGGIAHDLNNMLVGILGNANLAQSHIGDDALVGERLERIVKACERASKVIRQILAYSGRITCDAAPLDLNALADELSEFIRAAIPRNIELVIQRHSEPLTIEADDGQLQQVLTNLLVNAVEAIGERPGRISVEVASQKLGPAELRRQYPGQELKPGAYGLLTVGDNGCGMAAETVQHIFEPFYSSKGAGRGLGMPALRGIVRAHGGGVCVESTPGVGTRVTVAFPLSSAVPLPAPAPAVESQAPDRITVLVIDDEEDVRDVMEQMLRRRGVRVLSAADGADGLLQFARSADAIDVVVLDMTMPGKGGPDVYHELRALRADVPIIVSSGYMEQGTLARLGVTHAIPFIQKPFTSDALIQQIHAALRCTQAPSAGRLGAVTP